MSHRSSQVHSEFQERLYLEGDGELSTSELRTLRRHLGECSACRREQRELERLGDLLSEAVVPVDEEFTRRIMERLPEAGWEARSFAGWRLALAVFALLCAASAALGLGGERLASEVPVLGAALALMGLFRSALVAGGGLLAASWTGIGMALEELFQGSRVGFAFFGVLVLGIDVLFVRFLLRFRSGVEESAARSDSD